MLEDSGRGGGEGGYCIVVWRVRCFFKYMFVVFRWLVYVGSDKR